MLPVSVSPVLSAMLTSVPVPPLPSDGDSRLDRAGTYSRKLQGRSGEYEGRDVVPMWVADMCLSAPQPIVDAIVARAQHGVYGYTDCPAALTASMLTHLEAYYECRRPEATWFRWLPGLLPGLNHAVRACCTPGSGDAVAVATPIYPPFLDTATNCGAALVRVPLTEARLGDSSLRHSIEWGALEATLAAPTTKVLLWCNPHNPTGRCWSRDDLLRLARLCVEHEVTLLSDEVWGEMPLSDDAPFTSCLSLLAPEAGEAAPEAGPEAASETGPGVGPETVAGLRQRLIVLTSPSKTYNVASLDIALAIVPHAPLLARFRAVGRDAAEVTPFGYTAALLTNPNPNLLTPASTADPNPNPNQVTPFGYTAALAAYSHPECAAWRLRLLTHLRANRDHALAVLAALPGVRATCPEASYLMWLDVTDALPEGVISSGVTATEHLLSHGVALSDGVTFGATAGHVRLNLGCTREMLDRALQRMQKALAADAEIGK